MTGRLAGKVAVITGATNCIGLDFVKPGATLAFDARNPGNGSVPAHASPTITTSIAKVS